MNKLIKAIEKNKSKFSTKESWRIQISRNSFSLSSKDKGTFQTSALKLHFGNLVL